MRVSKRSTVKGIMGSDILRIIWKRGPKIIETISTRFNYRGNIERRKGGRSAQARSTNNRRRNINSRKVESRSLDQQAWPRLVIEYNSLWIRLKHPKASSSLVAWQAPLHHSLPLVHQLEKFERFNSSQRASLPYQWLEACLRSSRFHKNIMNGSFLTSISLKIEVPIFSSKEKVRVYL